MRRQLFVDMDGVLADFAAHYGLHFGLYLDRLASEPPDMWDNIRSLRTFYRDLPLLPDARELWDGCCRLHARPVVLTGVPYREVPEAEPQKRAWLAEHLGADVPVICCRSKDKRLYGRPGDVLVDDWPKYRVLWEAMGGTFVQHRSAATTLPVLRALYLTAPVRVY